MLLIIAPLNKSMGSVWFSLVTYFVLISKYRHIDKGVRQSSVEVIVALMRVSMVVAALITMLSSHSYILYIV